MADTQKILIDVEVQSNIKDIANLTVAVTKLRDQNKELTKDYAKNSETIELNRATIANLAKEIKQKQTVLQSEVKTLDESSGAYAKLNLQYSISAQRAKDIAVAYGLNSAESKKASKEAFELSEKLKAVDKSVGQNTRSVGDYEVATRKLPGVFGTIQSSATSAFGSVQKQLKSIQGTVKDYSTALKLKETAERDAKIATEAAILAEKALANAMAEATVVKVVESTTEQANTVVKVENEAITILQAEAEIARATATNAATVATEAGTVAMKIFKYAMASTGIGLLVVALGSLVAYFASTNEGAKTFKKIFEGVSAVIQQGVKILGAWGKLLFDAVTLNFSALTTDFKNFTNEVINSGKNIKKVYDEGYKSMEARQLLTKQEREWMVTRTKWEGDYNVLVQNASKRSRLSDADKLKSAKEAIALKNKMYTYDLFYAKQNEKLTKEEQGLKSKKDYQAIADARVRTQRLIATKKSEINTIENLMGKTEDRIGKNAEKADAKKEKEKDDAIKAEEKRLSKLEAIYKLIGDSQSNEIKRVNEEYKQARIDLFEDTKIDANERMFLELALEKEKQEKIQEIKNKYTGVGAIGSELQKQYANEFLLAKDNQRRLLELKVLFYESELEEFKKKQKEEQNLSIEIQRANEQAVLEAEQNLADSKQSIQNLSTQTQLNNVRNNQDLEYQIKKDALDKELKAVKGNVDEEARIKKELFDLEQANNDRLLAQRVAIANQTLSIATSLSNAYKANEDKQLNKTTEANDKKKESLKAQMDAGIITQEKYNKEVAKLDKEADKQKAIIARKQAIRNRNLALAQITINTAEAVSKAYAQGGTAGFITGGLMLAMGAAETAVVMNTEIPKASRGRYISGKSHANGGEIIEAEGGEVVMTKKAVSMYRGQLSAMNVAGGGVSFGGGGVVGFNDGGYSMRNNQYGMNSLTKADMIEALQGLTIVTTIEDIKREEKKYNKITSSGTF